MSALNKARDLQAGGIAAGHAATADAGARILNAGGTAFEAAASALLAAFLAEPVFASPGGGGFATIRLANGDISVLDFFVDLPGRKLEEADLQGVEVDFGGVTQGFVIGNGTAAVPGMETGLRKLLSLGGGGDYVPLEGVFGAALASLEGLTITPMQADLFQIVSPILTATEDARAIYAPGGTLLKAGDPFNNRDLTRLLANIRQWGHRSLAGFTRPDAVLALQMENGGHLTEADYHGYDLADRLPVCLDTAQRCIASNPLPAMGGLLALAMLNETLGRSRKGSFNLSDRARAIQTVDRAWRGMHSPSDLAQQFGIEITPDTKSDKAPQAFNGTTHISVIDRLGNAVAVTVTNGEGNGHIVPGCGYMMNNMLGEADVNPAGADGWLPSKTACRRLSSMMAPTIVDHADQGVLALGSGGSNRIRTALYQVLANRFETGMSLREAVLHPRIHGEQDTLDVEDATNQPEAQALEGLFKITNFWDKQSLYFGGVHAVERTGRGRFEGVGDPRREGVFIAVD